MTTLTNQYVNNDLRERLFAARIADMAVELARQAGEEVKRPLSKDQLARALNVNSVETDVVLQLVWEILESAHAAGALPTEAYPPKIGA